MSTCIQPEYLVSGDPILVVSSSGKVERAQLEPGITLLQKAGFNVDLGPHVYNSHYLFAGTDTERLEDVQAAISSSVYKAIVFSRGGYGASRIIDYLDFTPLLEYPKWLVGFSDITAIHAHVLKELNMQTIHAAMPYNLSIDFNALAYETLVAALRGSLTEYVIPAHPLNEVGILEGKLVGGNLSIIYSLLGTNTLSAFEDAILFIEDIGEFDYHLDRMMLSLKRAGVLNAISGVLVGSFTGIKEGRYPFGFTPLEIIKDYLLDYDMPIAFGIPAGHQSDNRALYLGRETHVKITKTETTISFTE